VTGAVRVVVTLAVFAAVLVAVVVRPRGWNEAWWTVFGAIAMLGLGLVSPREAIEAALAGKNALLFLLSLLSLSMLVGKSGFFEWAALRCARFAKGDARILYRNAFLLGAIVTAVLSLDTTAVILTPVVLALVRRLKMPSAPYVVLCAFVANVGSLLLPVSNLTNILFADAFHLGFTFFASRMLVPQLVALLTTYTILRWQFRAELPERFELQSLPGPDSAVPDRRYFVMCVTVLIVVLMGYFLAPLVGVATYVIAFAGSGVLAIAGAASGRVRFRAFGELAWGVFPFVVGLFIVVRGLENLGVVDKASTWLAHGTPRSPESLVVVSGATASASNVMNNLPAALLARSVLLRSHADVGMVLAGLVGADVGPMITPFGSLATMLVLALARREGQEPRAGRLLVLGLWATPLIVVAATLALTVVVHLGPR
jgi:arsenical pump membrane protein